MNYKLLYLIFIFSLFANSLFAQSQSQVWHFGENVSVSFGTSPPEALNNSALYSTDGSSVLCNANGSLICYSNGETLWSQFNSPMYEGRNLSGNQNSAQSSLLIAKPGNNSLIYLFTTSAYGTSEGSGFCYSVADWTASSYTGQIVEKNTNLLPQNQATERITAVQHQNNIDYWIITHKWNSNEFAAFLLTASGINPNPIISSVGSVHNLNTKDKSGYLKASPNGTKLAVALRGSSVAEAFNFNAATGEVSSPIQFSLPLSREPYGIEFSPDNTKLYVSFVSPNSGIYQLDLSKTTTDEILTSATLIATAEQYQIAAIQIAKNDTIYVAGMNRHYLGTITQPNNSASECGYLDMGLYLNGRVSKMGLPNTTTTFLEKVSFTISNFCEGDETQFQISNSSGITSVYWDFGDDDNAPADTSIEISPTYQYSNYGTFNVSLITNRNGQIDTVWQTISIAPKPKNFLGNDTLICFGNVVDANAGSASNYLWHNGYTDYLQQFSVSTQAWVDIETFAGCTGRDTLQITVADLPNISLGNDTTICKNSSFVLDAGSEFSAYEWQNAGSTESTFIVQNNGIYHVTATNANGCQGSDTIIITTDSIPSINFGNDTTICNGSQIVLQTADGYGNYLWQNNSSANSQEISTTGTYWLNITNNCGLFADTIEVTTIPSPEISLGSDLILCTNDTLVLSVATGFDSYLWNVPDSLANTLTVLQGGDYWVDVTNGNNCTTRDSIVVTTALSSVFLGEDTTIYPNAPIILDAGNEFVSYEWHNGSSEQEFLADTAGIYFITVTDELGCSTTDSITITVNADCQEVVAAVDFNNSQPLTTDSIIRLCPNDKAVSLSGYGIYPENNTTYEQGDAGSLFIWNYGDGQIDTMQTVNHTYSSSGGYRINLRIVDIMNCTSINSIDFQVQITESPITKTENTQICVGNEVVLNAGIAPLDVVELAVYSYANIEDSISFSVPIDSLRWSGENIQSATSSSISVTTEIDGTYNYLLKVYDSFGCLHETTSILTINPNPTVNLGVDTSVCSGGSLLFDAGDSQASYLWSDNSDNQTFTASQEGDIWAKVTNLFGCFDIDTVSFTVLEYPQISLREDTIICENSELTLWVDTVYVSYLWNIPDSTDNTLTINQNGTYSIEVIDSGNHCVGRDSVNIYTYENPTFNLGNDTTTCSNNPFTITANGDYTFLWNDGSSSNQITVNTTGSYWTIATNSVNCQNADTIEVIVQEAPEINLGIDTAICFGDTIVFDAGTGYDNYFWNVTGQTAQTLRADTAGVYFVDASITGSLCHAYDTISLSVNQLPFVTLGEDTALCQNDTVIFDAGEGFVSYAWNVDGENTQILRTDTAGTFNITVSDENNCIGRDTVVFSLYPLPIAGLEETDSICEGTNLTLDAGTGYTNYLWSNDSTVQSIVVNISGLYWIELTDAHNCIGRDSISITVLPVAAELSLGVDTTICEQSTVTFNAGLGFDTYLWNLQDSTLQTMTVAEAGTYWVEVSNECGTDRDSIVLSVAPLPVIELGSDTTLCEGDIITLDAGNSFTAYLWSDLTTNQTLQVSENGTYSVVVESAANCENQDFINIIFSPLPWVNIGHDFALCEGDSSILDAGLGFVSYQWSQGDTVQSIQIKTPDTYIVNISDGNLCLGSDTINVSHSPSPVFDSIYNPDDGQLVIGVENYSGTSPYQYRISDTFGTSTEQYTAAFFNLEPGTYTVEVIDDNGCIITSEGIVADDLEVFIPNVFTPNGDGANDFWRVPILDDFSDGIARVYDRWGKLIHEFESGDSGWNGNYNGTAMPSDSYWYIVTLKKGKTFTGYFTLKR